MQYRGEAVERIRGAATCLAQCNPHAHQVVAEQNLTCMRTECARQVAAPLMHGCTSADFDAICTC